VSSDKPIPIADYRPGGLKARLYWNCSCNPAANRFGHGLFGDPFRFSVRSSCPVHQQNRRPSKETRSLSLVSGQVRR
jgi:hypothetical protein